MITITMPVAMVAIVVPKMKFKAVMSGRLRWQDQRDHMECLCRCRSAAPHGIKSRALIRDIRPAFAGEIRMGGASLRGRTPEAIARSGVALVPEGRRLFAELTVEENLRLGLAARSGSAGVEEDLAEIYALFPVCEEFRVRFDHQGPGLPTVKDYVDALNGLGSAQFERGNYEAALSPLEKALQGSRRALSAEPPEVTTLRGKIAWSLYYL